MATLDLIGSEEAAKLLGITRAGLRKRVTAGAIKPAAVVGPRNVMGFDRAEIEAMKEANK